jgi:hypothetical protein
MWVIIIYPFENKENARRSWKPVGICSSSLQNRSTAGQQGFMLYEISFSQIPPIRSNQIQEETW